MIKDEYVFIIMVWVEVETGSADHDIGGKTLPDAIFKFYN
jgi:hypothetical protein